MSALPLKADIGGNSSPAFFSARARPRPSPATRHCRLSSSSRRSADIQGAARPVFYRSRTGAQCRRACRRIGGSFGPRRRQCQKNEKIAVGYGAEQQRQGVRRRHSPLGEISGSCLNRLKSWATGASSKLPKPLQCTLPNGCVATWPMRWTRSRQTSRKFSATANSGGLSELPILRGTKVELYINLKSAKELDLSVPPALLTSLDSKITMPCPEPRGRQ